MTQVESHQFCHRLRKENVQFCGTKQPYHTILLPFLFVWSLLNLLSVILLVSTVSQLQQTLGSVQELLIQQQQRIQELSQELAAAEVATTSSATEQLTTTNLLEYQWFQLKLWDSTCLSFKNYLFFLHHLPLALVLRVRLQILAFFFYCNLVKADNGASIAVGDAPKC